MSALYGRMQGARGEVTRLGHNHIWTRLETWKGTLELELHRSGDFVLKLGDKGSPQLELLRGNLDRREVWHGADLDGFMLPGSRLAAAQEARQ